MLTVPFAGTAQAAATEIPLGTAADFSVLAGSTVTNTGTTTVAGSVGVHPGTAITGQNTMVIGGTVHSGDAVALQAQTDLTTAYGNAAGQTPPIAADPELGGETLVGGVYNRAAAMALNGVLTLDGQNDPDSVWVFQAGTTLITGSAASVVLINGADPCNVYWQVGSSATIGTTTAFVGNIMADQSIAMQTGATLQGRALARIGAVTLDNNVITNPICRAGGGDGGGGNGDGGGGNGDGGNGDGGNGDGGNGDGGNGDGGNGSSGDGSSGGNDTPQITTPPSGSVDTGDAGPAVSAGGVPAPLLLGQALSIAGCLSLAATRRCLQA
ncbi:ice-binding family protein [Nocardioides sp. YIM B13467]|uniref:ice-binding family protein n=1 Tax=Nocardioides sp. YIM B13467 TaxID=3366294 RepID=UPI00366D99BF